MNLQYIRSAHLLVGSPGNPAKIGTAGQPGPGKQLTVNGTAYSVAADGSVTIPGSVYDALPDTEVGYQGVTLNTDGTRTLTGVSGLAVGPIPGLVNMPATPSQGLDLSQLRIKFTVTSRTIQTSKTLDARIYNLSSATANLIHNEFTRVRLTAGYQGSEGLLFDGTLTGPARIGRESQADTALSITAFESDLAHNFAVINITLAAGSTADTTVAAVLKALEPYGITKGYIPPLGGPTLPRGQVLSGMVSDVMRQLAVATACDWHIEGDQLFVIPQAGVAPGPVSVLTSRTGMIGLPELTTDGLHVRNLLNCKLTPGRAIRIDNASVQQMRIGGELAAPIEAGMRPKIAGDGYYKIYAVTHTGDTRGTEWYTDLICTSLKDGPAAATLSVADPGAAGG